MHAARSESVTFALGYTHLSDFPTDRLESPRRLIINFLPQNSTDDEVMRIFAPFGRVINLKVIRDKRTRSCLGYGFIEYSTPQEAIVAIEHGNGVQLRNKRLKVWYSRKPAPGMRDSNVYVQNYGEMLEDWQLVDIFSQFGRVINMNMLRDKQGKSRGAAFVRMDSHEEAVQAVNALNGTMIGGKRIFAKIHEAPAVPLHKGGIPWQDIDNNEEYGFIASQQQQQLQQKMNEIPIPIRSISENIQTQHPTFIPKLNDRPHSSPATQYIPSMQSTSIPIPIIPIQSHQSNSNQLIQQNKKFYPPLPPPPPIPSVINSQIILDNQEGDQIILNQQEIEQQQEEEEQQHLQQQQLDNFEIDSDQEDINIRHEQYQNMNMNMNESNIRDLNKKEMQSRIQQQSSLSANAPPFVSTSTSSLFALGSIQSPIKSMQNQIYNSLSNQNSFNFNSPSSLQSSHQQQLLPSQLSAFQSNPQFPSTSTIPVQVSDNTDIVKDELNINLNANNNQLQNSFQLDNSSFQLSPVNSLIQQSYSLSPDWLQQQSPLNNNYQFESNQSIRNESLNKTSSNEDKNNVSFIDLNQKRNNIGSQKNGDQMSLYKPSSFLSQQIPFSQTKSSSQSQSYTSILSLSQILKDLPQISSDLDQLQFSNINANPSQSTQSSSSSHDLHNSPTLITPPPIFPLI